MQKEAGGGNPFRLSSFGDGILPLWAVSLFVSDATNGCPLLPTQSLEVLANNAAKVQHSLCRNLLLLLVLLCGLDQVMFFPLMIDKFQVGPLPVFLRKEGTSDPSHVSEKPNRS